MRVHSISLENINSLQGHWTIDLDDPVYAQNGLFGIIGPTGAGKSTILDALSLALYGRTPRISRFNGEENEVMSRGCHSCSAGVTFSCSGKTYRAEWSQHRAHKRNEGKLQNVQRRFWEIASPGQGLEKITQVQGRIEEVTGLKFEQFCRSVLLAQGGFAAFLKAPEEERAQALEQLTGTEIYAEISRQVHERSGAEKAALDNLDARLSSYPVLTDEQRKSLSERVQIDQSRHAQLSDQFNQAQTLLSWLQGLERREAELRSELALQAALEKENLSLKESRRVLDLARRAEPLRPSHATLASLRESVAQRRRARDRIAERIDPARRQLESARKRLDAAAQAASRRAQEEEALLPILAEVRKLDARIDGAQLDFQKSETALESFRRKLDAENKALAGEQEKQEMLLADQQKVSKWLASHESDTGLLEHARMISETRTLLTEKIERRKGLREEIQERQKALSAVEAELKKVRPELDRTKALCSQALERVARLEREDAGTIGHRSIADWSIRLADLTREESDIGNLKKRVIEHFERLDALREANARIALIGQEVEAVRAQSGKAIADVAQLQLLREEIEARRRFADQVASLAELRATLRKGDPCPLCGATEHPGILAREERDTVAAKLLEVEKELKGAIGRERDLSRALARATGNLQVRSEEFGRERNRAEKLAGELEESLRAVSLSLDAETAGRLASRLESLEDIASSIRELVRCLGECEKAEKALEGIRSRVESARNDLAHGKALESTLEGEIKTLAEPILALAENFPGEDETPGEAGTVVLCDALSQRIARLEEEQTRAGEIARAIQAQTERQEQARARVVEREREVLDAQGIRDASRQALEALRQDRMARFADRDCDRVERETREAVLAAARMLDESRESHRLDSETLSGLKASLSTLENQIAEEGARLEELEPAWTQSLTRAEFADEDAWRKACLEAGALKALEETIEDIDRRLAQSRARALAHRESIERDRARALTQHSSAEQQAIVTDLDAQRNACAASLTQGRAALENDQGIRSERDRVQTERDRQSVVCARWEHLRALIGSSDGKKFRQYVQGLQFEALVHRANLELQGMSERYFLVRGKDSPLRLNVIDRYQAGAVRSTDNLSGGETFLVSLSLALGLSRLASSRVRIDSLFLDEGFGTLDEKTLESALEALGRLQSSGKRIAVISHVDRIREWLPARIEVTPQGNGTSVLAGPGVRRTGA